MGARVGSCTWILLEIDLTELVIETKFLAGHSFTDRHFLFISHIGRLVSAGPWSRIRPFNEIQGTVLSECSLCADCSWSIFAVGYLSLVVTELRHVSAYSCNSAGLFLIVHHALAVLSARSW